MRDTLLRSLWSTPCLAVWLLSTSCKSTQAGAPAAAMDPADGSAATTGQVVETSGAGGQGNEARRIEVGDSGPWHVWGAQALEGGELEFGVVDDDLVAAAEVPDDARYIDLGGRIVVPAFIDSHVHLAYYDVAEALPAGGVVAAVDFAQPLETLATPFILEARRAGPMITAPGGYPTQSWGSNGYGLEVATPAEAEAAVDRLLDLGADFIKAPILGELGLDDQLLRAVVQRAHERDVRVALHALTAADAERALASDADVLAHTPSEPLSTGAVEEWGDRAVVSTLAAFGAGQAAIDNLRALADVGATVLYGTDLGNTRLAGIQPAEIEALLAAGFSTDEIVHSATSEPAIYWGFDDLGSLGAGKRASFLVLEVDPEVDPLTLANPRAVVAKGVLVAGALP